MKINKIDSYRKGSNFERLVVERYRAVGKYAARTAGSHSEYDVIVGENPTLYIQCKARAPTKKDRESVQANANRYKLRSALAYPTNKDEFTLEEFQPR